MKLAVGSALTLLVSSPVLAQSLGSAGGIPWKLNSGLTVSETYSDNINLAPAGQERSDVVTDISPYLRVLRSGPNLKLNVSYSPELLFYANGTNGSTIRNSLNGVAQAVVLKDFLFFDANAQISQQNASPFGVAAADTVNGSSNRAETRSLILGPHITSRFADNVTYNLGYQYSISNSNSDALSRSSSDQWTGSLAGAATRDLNWSLTYSRVQTHYDQLTDYSTQSALARLTYLYDSRLNFFAEAGHDSNSYTVFTGEQSGGASYSVGLQWIPGPTTSLNAQYGHRYFGSTRHLQLSHRTPWSTWQIGYDDDQTSSAQLLSGPGTLGSQGQFNSNSFGSSPNFNAGILNNPLQQNLLPNGQIDQSNLLSNQLFQQKRLDLSVVLTGRVNTVTLGYDISEQKALSNQSQPDDIFAANRSYRQNALTVAWSYTLGPRTSASATAFRSRSVAVDGVGDTKQRIFSASIQRQLQKKLSAVITLRNTHQSGVFQSVGSLGGGDYSENSLIGSLRLQF